MLPSKTTFRVSGIPSDATIDNLNDALLATCSDDEKSSITFDAATICMSCYNDNTQTALVQFSSIPRYLEGCTKETQLEIGDWELNIDVHFYGFTQLYPVAPRTKIKADIIAVTGLDGHAFGSWRDRGALRQMWLRDFLPQVYPNCRTMIYGYNSKLQRDAGFQTTLDFTRGLLHEIRKIRSSEEEMKRPAIFIGHSFGGIIIAQTLLKSKDYGKREDPILHYLFPATIATIFFATPHRGLIVDDILTMLGENSSRTSLVQSIQKNADNLVHDYYRFINAASKSKLSIVSFYEQQQSRRLQRDGNGRFTRSGDHYIPLDAQYSLLHLPDTIEAKVPVDKNHSEIVKFDSIHDQAYTTLLWHLERLIPQGGKCVAPTNPPQSAPSSPISSSVSPQPMRNNPTTSSSSHQPATTAPIWSLKSPQDGSIAPNSPPYFTQATLLHQAYHLSLGRSGL